MAEDEDDDKIAEEEKDPDLAAWEAMLAEEEKASSSTAEDSYSKMKTLNQDEIDSLLGFELNEDDTSSEETGIRAMLSRALLSYERLPMLEVVFDRFARMLSTSLRNLTSDNVDVDIRSISSLRFDDYINSIPMPALITVFKAMEWENFGIITSDGPMIFSLVDVLFGGKRANNPIKLEGRPYTVIEQNVMKQLSDIMLVDLGAAFDQLSPATFQFERIETNPRFATIARPADPAILLQLRIDMEERGGRAEILFPYATLEPIRELLLQVFMGEKFGQDSNWDLHMEYEIFNTELKLEATLGKKKLLMKEVFDFKIGDTILLNMHKEDPIVIKCENIDMVAGEVGRVDDNIAIKVTKKLNKKLREMGE